MLENGQEMNVNNGGEMQLNVNNFFNDNIIEKLNKILVTLKNWNKTGGKRQRKIRKERKGKLQKNLGEEKINNVQIFLVYYQNLDTFQPKLHLP